MENTETRSRKRRMREWFREIVSLSVVVGLCLIARASIADHYIVPTGSMEPTVNIDDRLVVNKMAYGIRIPLTQTWVTRFEEPSPGEVVVLDSPVDGPVLLKRVIGGPGDTVAIRGGRIYLNGMQQPVRYEKDKLQECLNEKVHPVALTLGGGPDFGPTLIPDDKFLVVGDNRGLSHDGRYFGLVERKTILGRAVGIYFSNSSPTWREL